MDKNKQEINRNWSFSDDRSNIILNYHLSSGVSLNIEVSSDFIFDPEQVKNLKVNNILETKKFESELIQLRVNADTIEFNRTINSKVAIERQCYFVWLYILDNIIEGVSSADRKLYIMQNQDGYIKIGISKNPDRRRETLQRELGDDIEILKVLKFHEYERKLHSIFHPFNANYKGQREWFTPYPELLKWVDSVSDNNFEKLYNKLCQKKLNIQKKK